MAGLEIPTGPGAGLANGLIPAQSWNETQDPPEMQGTVCLISSISQDP